MNGGLLGEIREHTDQERNTPHNAGRGRRLNHRRGRGHRGRGHRGRGKDSGRCQRIRGRGAGNRCKGQGGSARFHRRPHTHRAQPRQGRGAGRTRDRVDAQDNGTVHQLFHARAQHQGIKGRRTGGIEGWNHHVRRDRQQHDPRGRAGVCPVRRQGKSR